MQAGGNHYDKYNTRNPIARNLMARFLSSFDALAEIIPPGRALEAGCGEGELSMRLAARGWQMEGFDPDPAVVAEARSRVAARGLNVEFNTGNLNQYRPAAQTFGLAVCCEVLEHVENPDRDFQRLLEFAPYVLVSVPREPIWRALNLVRGKYLGALGNTPGHIQHWSKGSFLQFLRQHADIVAVRTPLPWTMALCASRKFGGSVQTAK